MKTLKRKNILFKGNDSCIEMQGNFDNISTYKLISTERLLTTRELCLIITSLLYMMVCLWLIRQGETLLGVIWSYRAEPWYSSGMEALCVMYTRTGGGQTWPKDKLYLVLWLSKDVYLLLASSALFFMWEG